jgi:tetratricopeptide (TPR) repeat protein
MRARRAIPGLVRGRAACLALLASLAIAPGTAAADLTFNRDIAPIVWKRCGACHRPAATAPFSLLDYRDVRARARQILAAVRSGVMPPWLPAAGHGEFQNERRMPADEIARLAEWIGEGAREGNPADLPPRPLWNDGWQLGAPDLVVTVPTPYVLTPGSSDTFRTFVVPIPLAAARWVRGVEIDPGHRQLVHHASLSIDRTRESRRLDEADPQPGFAGGMLSRGARSPEGRAVGWTPGITPAFEPEGMAWRLNKGSDLVIQVHMLPPERGSQPVQPRVAFYFSDTAPTLQPLDFKLGSKTIDIPAGAAGYTITDSYVLPAGVELISVYPHAHYLAREMTATATLPDGAERLLLRIDRWDFHWQDEYRFVRPVALPAGTRLSMRFTYDNSARSPRHPRRRPERVRFGPQSSDEMGDLWLRLVPKTPEAAAAIAGDFSRRELQKDIDAGLSRAAAEPGDIRWRNALGASFIRAGRPEDAIQQLEQALRIDPASVEARNNLGHALQLSGRLREALAEFREAARLAPRNDLAHLNVANTLQDLGEVAESIGPYRQAIALNPDAAEARNNLGAALASLGDLDAAEQQFREALALQPDYADALTNLEQLLEVKKRDVRDL